MPLPPPTPGVSTPAEIEAWMNQQLPNRGAPPLTAPPAVAASSRPVSGWLLLGSAALLGWWFLRK